MKSLKDFQNSELSSLTVYAGGEIRKTVSTQGRCDEIDTCKSGRDPKTGFYPSSDATYVQCETKSPCE